MIKREVDRKRRGDCMEGEKLPSKLNVDTDIICSMEDGEGRYGSKVVRKRVICSVLGVP